MSRLDAPLEPGTAGTVRAHLAALPGAVSERLASRGMEGSIRLVFEEPAPATRDRCRPQSPAAGHACGIADGGRAESWIESRAAAGTHRRVADLRRKLLTTRCFTSLALQDHGSWTARTAAARRRGWRHRVSGPDEAPFATGEEGQKTTGSGGERQSRRGRTQQAAGASAGAHRGRTAAERSRSTPASAHSASEPGSCTRPRRWHQCPARLCGSRSARPTSSACSFSTPGGI